MIDHLPDRRRRDMIGLAGLAGLALSTTPATAARTRKGAGRGELVTPVPLPAPAPVREGHVDVPGARLYYWDTGGEGAAVVLAHPATGSALIWGYQQPALAAAGYRVIGYSRRGHARSESVGATLIGDTTEDLDRLADALHVGRFHGLGSAAGGGVMLDYAVSRPARLRTLIVACSIGNIADPVYRAVSAALRPELFNKLPAEFRELGPCYRAGDPQGVGRWLALEKQARTEPLPPMPRATTTWDDVARLRLPVLWLTGDADLFTPPPLLREFHRRVAGSEIAVIDGAGHSAYWEQPTAFNATVIDFLRRRGR